MWNRDKQEAHLSLPALYTKTTKAEEETHWVLEAAGSALLCSALDALSAPPAASAQAQGHCSPGIDHANAEMEVTALETQCLASAILAETEML